MTPALNSVTQPFESVHTSGTAANGYGSAKSSSKLCVTRLSASMYTAARTGWGRVSSVQRRSLVYWSTKRTPMPEPFCGGSIRSTGCGSKPDAEAMQRASAETWEGRYRRRSRALVFTLLSEWPSARTPGANSSVYSVVTTAFSFAAPAPLYTSMSG